MWTKDQRKWEYCVKGKLIPGKKNYLTSKKKSKKIVRKVDKRSKKVRILSEGKHNSLEETILTTIESKQIWRNVYDRWKKVGMLIEWRKSFNLRRESIEIKRSANITFIESHSSMTRGISKYKCNESNSKSKASLSKNIMRGDMKQEWGEWGRRSALLRYLHTTERNVSQSISPSTWKEYWNRK